MSDLTQAWDKLEELGVSEETIQVVTSINGYNMKSMEDILHVTVGYNSFEQLEEEEE